MNVARVSQQTGLPIKTLHDHEETKLVVPNRQENGYRVYNNTDVHKRAFINRARRLGFSGEDCRTLVLSYEDENRASADVKAIDSRHLDEIKIKIKELMSLRDILKHLVATYHGNDRPNCPVIDGLAGDGKL